MCNDFKAGQYAVTLALTLALWQHSISGIIALPALKLTNQNQRHYHFCFESSVAPNWQTDSAKAGSLKQRQNTADFLGLWAK